MASSRITGTNENISTYGVLATPRDYDVLTDWEQFSDYDLVAATTSEVLECYADAASYADTITMANATTNSSYFRIIRPAAGEGHDGTPNTGIIFTGTSTIFLLQEGYASIYDIAATVTANSAANISPFDISSTGDPNKRLVGCIAFDCTNAGAGAGYGFSVGADTAYVIDCLALRADGYGFYSAGAATHYFYNLTAIDCDIGFRNDATTTTLFKNCLGYSNTTADFQNVGTITGSTNNASSDTSAVGTVTYSSQTFTFVNAANDDFHLHRNDLGAKFRGTNLSADANFPFNDDIDGDTITNWSIGFHAEETTQSSRRTGDNENISTFAASGADYNAITDWESFTDNDLVTGAVTEVLECAAGTYSDGLAALSATTDGRYFRIIRPAAGAEHNGTPSSGVIFSGTGTNHFDIAENFFSVQDLVIISAGNSAGTVSALRVTATTQVTIIGCIAKATNAGAGTGNSFTANHASGTSRFVNCLAYESDGTGFFLDGAGTKRALNCTSINNGVHGFRRNNGTVTTINCLGDGNLTADFDGTMTDSNYNAATDATTTGANSRNNQTFKYVNDSGTNYHLTAADAGAKGFGTSMATNNFYNYTDDVDSVTVTTWSIGFDSDPAHAGRKVNIIPLAAKVHGALV